ncbi:coiled-coil domain-containing protein [Paenibacillus sp. GCM10027627]|uniref:coiled-coil domain-containing protein n=1 Tax=unclassified Paenibacillus TaxID=185978 RepID=UPI003645E692
MTETTTRGRLATAIAAIAACALILLHLPVFAEQQPESSEDIHSLLEKSLSVVEIDKEILRIGEQKEALLLTMADAEEQLDKQELTIAKEQKKAGKVLKAYYMGERDMLYSALLSAKSITNFFEIWDYIDLIVSKDKRILNGYIGQYRDLQEQYKQLEVKQAALAATEQKLYAQKERVLALEAQLDEELKSRSDGERIKLMIDELTSFWETAGMTEVRSYFKALSKAMRELPAWVQDNKEMLETKGLQYTIRVPEEKLNEFLREQDQMFENFTFSFQEDKIIASGKRDDMEISISGHYSVQEEPKNGIIFHVDELLFNGFSLPDTTRKALEKDFDLGFYPGLILAFLKAKEVDVNEGELIIKLALSL